MIQAASLDSKDKIVAAFRTLLVDYQQRESKVATKEEEAEKEKNQQLLAEAANYTVDNIVNSMASLQLDFGNIINELKEKLTTESDKLGKLNKAIAVEQENIKQLRQVRLIADALHILRQEHQQQIAGFEDKLKEEYNQAKGEAIKEAERKAKVQTDLLEKEWSATQQGYELKLQSLEANIARQIQQINELTTQLQEANTQAQNLALRAFNSEQ